MAGGIVAALIGPTLARFGGPLFQHLEYIGSFLIISIISLVAMGILSSLHIANTVEQKSNFTAGRPWQKIVFQPTYLVAFVWCRNRLRHHDFRYDRNTHCYATFTP